MERNKVFHLDFLDNTIPSDSADLIIVDPPYFEVKGKFDFVWNSFDDYLKDVEKWAIECKRILKNNGTIYWWGHAMKIAYSQVVLDKHFSLLNNMVWRKSDCRTQKSSLKNMRRFAPVTERLLMYDKGSEYTGLERIYSDKDCFASIKKYMRDERDKLMKAKGFKKVSEFDAFINAVTETKSVVSKHYFADSQYNFPTPEIYKKLQSTGFWLREYEDLRREYEDLRREYEDLRRCFNLDEMTTDVIVHGQEAHITKNFKHDTKKPPGLVKILIEASTKAGDLVVVPFSGS